MDVHAGIDPDYADRANLFELRDEAWAREAFGDDDLAANAIGQLLGGLNLLLEHVSDHRVVSRADINELPLEAAPGIGAVGRRLCTKRLAVRLDAGEARQA